MDFAIAVGVVVAIGNAAKQQFPKITGLYGIALSVIVGIVIGFFGLFGVTGIENGVLVGLSASGVYTLAKRVGGN